MSRNANDIPAGDGGSKFQKEVLKPNGYPARLVSAVFVGVQNQRPFKGEAKPPVDEVRFTYELSHEFMKSEEGEVLDDKPRWLTESIPYKSLKLDRAKFTKRYKALDPAMEFKGDVKQLLGAGCTVVVTNNPGSGKHAGRVFENIGDVTNAPNMPGYTQPELINDTFYYDPQDESCTLEEFRSQPEFVQEIILAANDYSTSVLAKQLAAENGQPAPESKVDAPEPAQDADEGDEESPY